MRLLREPLLHFLLIGAAIYGAYGYFAEPEQQADDKTITVSAGEIEWMRDNWQKRWMRPPTQQELDGLVQQYIKETILYREALTMGLNQHDPIIRRRLAQKLEFLAKDLVTLTEPTEAELQSYFDQHIERYRTPTLYSFTQVYFDPDRRDAQTLSDAEAAKAQLIAAGDTITDPGALGDRFMLPSEHTQLDRLGISRQFGSGFADAVLKLAPGEWHGPVLSGYGTHLVHVDEVITAPEPTLAEVHNRVRTDWETDRGEELNQQFFDELRSQYKVVIETPSAAAAPSSDANLVTDNSVAAVQGPAR